MSLYIFGRVDCDPLSLKACKSSLSELCSRLDIALSLDALDDEDRKVTEQPGTIPATLISLFMRLREKTLELNFCTQFERFVGTPIIWFGLTQMQEARAGFDACTRLGGRLFIFQFKASAYVLKSGARQFVAEHDQMQQLRNRCNTDRAIFYVFPMIGTTLELANNPDLISNSCLLDVADLPATISPPTTKSGRLRKNKLHYVDIMPPLARIHSDPFDVKLVNTSVFAGEMLRSSIGLKGVVGDSFERFYEIAHNVLRTSKAAAVL